jgi:hypothetical protein
MGGLFSSSNSNLGSVPKKLKDYIIKNPTENIKKMPCSGLLQFTDGDKDPYLTYRGRNEINNSKNKYIGVCEIPNKEPTKEETEEYKNNLFIYYIGGKEVEFKILTKFKEYISQGYEIAYKFENDNENYHPDDIYTVEKPKNNSNNNKKGGSRKKYKNKKKIVNKKKNKNNN